MLPAELEAVDDLLLQVGKEAEAGGIAKHGAKLVTAVACAQVRPRTDGSSAARELSRCPLQS